MTVRQFDRHFCQPARDCLKLLFDTVAPRAAVRRRRRPSASSAAAGRGVRPPSRHAGPCANTQYPRRAYRAVMCICRDRAPAAPPRAGGCAKAASLRLSISSWLILVWRAAWWDTGGVHCKAEESCLGRRSRRVVNAVFGGPGGGGSFGSKLRGARMIPPPPPQR
jgi:hypothetical protein